MQYALVNGIRLEPKKGFDGLCIGCGKDVIAKCGQIKVHHWAHKSTKECDSFWEPETLWHREWKNHFPEDFREVVFTDEKNDEIHRADIHTPTGVTIEFQNSPISLNELVSRDQFYKKLIWVVNGFKFIGNFELTSTIPNPTSPILAEFDILGGGGRDRYSMNVKQNLMFMRRSDLYTPDRDKDLILSIRGNELKAVGELMDRSEPLYWLFNWKHKHNAWFSTKSHVFLDFGNDFLFKLSSKEQSRGTLWYIQKFKKENFIRKYSKSNF